MCIHFTINHLTATLEMDRGEDKGRRGDKSVAEPAENQRGQACKAGKVNNAEMDFKMILIMLD